MKCKLLTERLKLPERFSLPTLALFNAFQGEEQYTSRHSDQECSSVSYNQAHMLELEDTNRAVEGRTLPGERHRTLVPLRATK